MKKHLLALALIASQAFAVTPVGVTLPELTARTPQGTDLLLIALPTAPASGPKAFKTSVDELASYLGDNLNLSSYQPLIGDGTLSLAKLATDPLARANHTGTQAWSTLTSTPTTLAGYGIADGITAATAASTYQPLIGTGTLSLAKLATDPLARANHTGTQAWSTLTSTPTTLAGYGIADGITAATAASTYQPLDATLGAIADAGSTAFGRELLTLTNAAALRSAADLGTIATGDAGDYVQSTDWHGGLDITLGGGETWAITTGLPGLQGISTGGASTLLPGSLSMMTIDTGVTTNELTLTPSQLQLYDDANNVLGSFSPYAISTIDGGFTGTVSAANVAASASMTLGGNDVLTTASNLDVSQVNAGTLPVIYGGTGGNDASSARAALGFVAGGPITNGDYYVTSGPVLLGRYNGSGINPLQTITIGSGLSLNSTTGVLSVAGGAGTVTSVSVATANGISGSVANSTTTPALTLSLGAITPSSTTTTLTSLGTTPTAAVSLINSTAATNSNQQVSPSIVLEGQGFKTTATAASQSVKVRYHVLPVQGTTAPSASIVWGYDIANTGTFTDLMKVEGTATNTLTLGTSASTGGFVIAGGYNTTSISIAANALQHSSGGSSVFRVADQYVTNPGITAGGDSGTYLIAISTASAATARTNTNTIGFAREAQSRIQWGMDEATTSGTITQKSPDVTTGTGWTHNIQGGNGSTAGGAVTITTSATSTPVIRVTIKASGVVNLSNVPTSSVGLSTGDIYSTAGALMIVP